MSSKAKSELSLSTSNNCKIEIPAWLIWIQCIAFVVLYAVWILPEVVGFRNTALVVGALTGLYPIYQYRNLLVHKRALPIWTVAILFVWATFHLLFLSHDYAAQLLEYKRIWKYAAIGAIFAFGLGLSLGEKSVDKALSGQFRDASYWWIIFLGLCTPVLIYCFKYSLTIYGAKWGIQPPAYLQIYYGSQPYYVPKTDYVAFCLPPLAIAIGQIHVLLNSKTSRGTRQYGAIAIYVVLIAATLFLFYFQNIKNGMAYAAICITLFVLITLFQNKQGSMRKKFIVTLVVVGSLALALYPHVQKNDTWKTLIADTKIAFQLDKYQQWKYAGAQGYPINEFGRMVSVTTYERAAWFKAGLQLASQTPLGYGLIEDSFKRMAKENWPEVSPNLSHSHSGWLDVVLAVGALGFALLFGTLILLLKQSRDGLEPWRSLVFWGLFSLGILWITTEVCATVPFAALIFWLSWGAGLTLRWVNCINEKNEC